jgi:hypothetical protein
MFTLTDPKRSETQEYLEAKFKLRKEMASESLMGHLKFLTGADRGGK